MDTEVLEECARLEDFMQALYEAQPKTVRERMQKIVEARTETKLDKQRTKNQEHLNDSKIVLLVVFLCIVFCWGMFLFLK